MSFAEHLREPATVLLEILTVSIAFYQIITEHVALTYILFGKSEMFGNLEYVKYISIINVVCA